MENVKHDHNTINKVMRVLIVNGGHTQSEASELINEFANAGILFRERGEELMTPVDDMGLANLPMTEAIHLAIGAASMCWIPSPGDAVFDDQRAADVALQLKNRVQLFVQETVPTVAETDTKAEQPKEWIEQQEQERRAWAVNAAVEWNASDIVQTATEIVEFVKAPIENPDLNDVQATDTFYLVMGEKIGDQEDWMATMSVEVSEFLIDCVDALAKEGVRLKDGKRLEA